MGALYVTAGDGVTFNFADCGQDGSPVNPCGDPPCGGPLIGSSDPNARRIVAQTGGVTNVGWPCPRHLRSTS